MKCLGVSFLPCMLACIFYSACVLKQETSDSKIVAGSFVVPEDPIYRATVSLDADGIPFCTGVLLDKRTVVTAAHCVKGAPQGMGLSIGFGSARFGNKTSVSFEKLTQMTAHQNWDGSDLNSTTIDPLPTSPKNDIGLVVLGSDAPNWSAPIPLKMIGSVNVGNQLVLAGFGQTRMLEANGFNPRIEARGEMRRVTVELAAINDRGWELIYKPLATAENGSSCHGDSGGPMFYKELDGSVTLIGVTSRGYSKEEDCKGRGIYTDVRKFDGWIKEQREKIIKNLGPSENEWQHKYIDAPSETRIAIDFQLSTAGLQRVAKAIWVNILNASYKGNEKIEVEMSSYISKLTKQNAIAEYAGGNRYTVKMSEFENQVVCSPYSRWGVQQAIAVKLNGKYLVSGQKNPNEFEFKFCD